MTSTAINIFVIRDHTNIEHTRAMQQISVMLNGLGVNFTQESPHPNGTEYVVSGDVWVLASIGLYHQDSYRIGTIAGKPWLHEIRDEEQEVNSPPSSEGVALRASIPAGAFNSFVNHESHKSQQTKETQMKKVTNITIAIQNDSNTDLKYTLENILSSLKPLGIYGVDTAVSGTGEIHLRLHGEVGVLSRCGLHHLCKYNVGFLGGKPYLIQVNRDASGVPYDQNTSRATGGSTISPRPNETWHGLAKDTKNQTDTSSVKINATLEFDEVNATQQKPFQLLNILSEAMLSYNVTVKPDLNPSAGEYPVVFEGHPANLKLGGLSFTNGKRYRVKFNQDSYPAAWLQEIKPEQTKETQMNKHPITMDHINAFCDSMITGTSQIAQPNATPMIKEWRFSVDIKDKAIDDIGYAELMQFVRKSLPPFMISFLKVEPDRIDIAIFCTLDELKARGIDHLSPELIFEDGQLKNKQLPQTEEETVKEELVEQEHKPNVLDCYGMRTLIVTAGGLLAGADCSFLYDDVALQALRLETIPVQRVQINGISKNENNEFKLGLTAWIMSDVTPRGVKFVAQLPHCLKSDSVELPLTDEDRAFAYALTRHTADKIKFSLIIESDTKLIIAYKLEIQD